MRHCPFVKDEMYFLQRGHASYKKNPMTGENEQTWKPETLVIWLDADCRTDESCITPGTAVAHRYRLLGIEPGCEHWDKTNKKCMLGSEAELEEMHNAKIERLRQRAKASKWEVEERTIVGMQDSDSKEGPQTKGE